MLLQAPPARYPGGDLRVHCLHLVGLAMPEQGFRVIYIQVESDHGVS
jgi:hypothetical protein